MVTPAKHPIFNSAVGGRPCLDFVNTVGARVRGDGDTARDGVERERLTTYDALLEWALWMGIVGRAEGGILRTAARRRPHDAAAVLARAIALREAIYRLFEATLGGRPVAGDDLATLDRELREARVHARIEPTGATARLRGRRAAARQRAGFRWTWADMPERLDRLLWPVVQSAADLLTSPDLARVGQCPAEGCGWLFLDTSRSGRRQWCDMAVCGNAAKVRRFRERQRGATGDRATERR